MHLKYNTMATYLTPAQKRAYEKFRESEPVSGTIYKSKNGAARECLGVKYPIGVINEDTVFGYEKKDGSRDYHTPLATVETGDALVYYREDGGDVVSCSGQEWLEFVSGGFTAEDAPESELPEAIKKARVAERGKVVQHKVLEDAKEVVKKSQKGKDKE